MCMLLRLSYLLFALVISIKRRLVNILASKPQLDVKVIFIFKIVAKELQ